MEFNTVQFEEVEPHIGLITLSRPTPAQRHQHGDVG